MGLTSLLRFPRILCASCLTWKVTASFQAFVRVDLPPCAQHAAQSRASGGGPCPRLAPVSNGALPLTVAFSSCSDYGFERAPSSGSDASTCFANFWFNPLSPPDDCVLGQTYTSSLG